MGLHSIAVAEFREDPVGQLLPKFNAPLVKAEDVPYHTLNEYFVLIHGDETTQNSRRKLLEED